MRADARGSGRGKALLDAIRADPSYALSERWTRLTIAEARRELQHMLADVGIASAEHDARELARFVLEPYRLDPVIDADRSMSHAMPGELARIAVRRLAREPLSHIVGRVGFWTIELAVTPDVLTPRPDSETVVEAALRVTADRAGGRVLDLGVGSGALLLAFLAERPGWSGVGVDASLAALEVAHANAQRNGLAERAAFTAADWNESFTFAERFDLVLSNPPYVASVDIAALEPEVRDHEPRIALDGGPDGLDAYRRLAPLLSDILSDDGAAVFEVGAGQGKSAAEVLAAALPGAHVEIVPDLAGRDRAVAATLRKQGL